MHDGERCDNSTPVMDPSMPSAAVPGAVGSSVGTSGASRRASRWRTRLEGWGAAVLAAAFVIGSMPTTELAPLAFVGLAPVLVAMRTRSRWQRLRLGWLAGLLVELALFRWIPFTMTEMTSLGGPVTLAMLAAYAAWHGLRFGVFLALAEPVRRGVVARRPSLGALAVGLTWVAVDWAWPVIFPWALGHAVWELPGAGELLALQGVPLLSWVVVTIAASLAELWVGRRDRRALRRTAVALVAFLAATLGPAALLAPGEAAPSVRVAIVQPNYTLAEKKHATAERRRQLLDRFEAQLRAIPADTFDLVIASEGSFPMWWRLDADDPAALPKNPQLDATRRVQRAIAEGPRTPAILGGLRQDERGRMRNSAVFIGADGRVSGHYDKQALVPFSEYAPLADVFPALGEIKGIGKLQPGDAPCRFDVPVAGRTPLRVTCGICYESLFAAATRRDAADAELLVNLTIDTWFGDSTAPRMHLMTQASRAAELGVPLARSALTGISAHVDVHGRLVADLPRDAPGVLSATLALADGGTVYRAIGQWLAPLACVLVLVLSAARLIVIRRARGAMRGRA